MSENLTVIQEQENELVQVQLSPVQIMQQAKAAGLEISEMKEMLALQKEYEANEARKAFHQALSEFKKNPPQIVKDKLNKQYGSNYTSIGNMVNTVNEALGEAGLNARWDFPPTDGNEIICSCILSHRLGHEESVTLSGPVDTSGAKNPLQGRKSARTYLKLETFEAVTGVASIDGNVNDDGNSSGQFSQPARKQTPVSPDPINQSKIEGAYSAFKEVVDADVDEMDFKRVQDGYKRLTPDEQIAVFSKFGKEKPEGCAKGYKAIIKELLAMTGEHE